MQIDMVESDLKTPEFIGAYQISEDICDELVSYFDKNERVANEGLFMYNEGESKVDHSWKQSKDLRVGPDEHHFPIWDYRQYLILSLRRYMSVYQELYSLSAFNINENYIIQKYPKGGGFKQWHFERTANVNIGRHLVFMTYLNDVDDGGTYFYHQKITSPAKKGLTLIWPTDWTHTHKGQISKKHEKYIITGWFSHVSKDLL